MDVPIFKRIQIYASALFMLVILFLRDGIITVRSVLGLGEKSSLGKIFKFKAASQMIRSNTLDCSKTAKLNESAPNATLLDLLGKKSQLLDCMRPNRPLVVNFGSCS